MTFPTQDPKSLIHLGSEETEQRRQMPVILAPSTEEQEYGHFSSIEEK